MTSHDEWYTPKEIIEPIRELYGGTIDLDPASCFEANKTIQADFTHDISEDGLNWEWFGNVWCNPPYCSRGTVLNWLKKATDESKSGRCEHIIMLLNRSDAKWYYDFLDNHQGAYYQFRNRIKFIDGLTGKPSSPRYNNDLIYWGNNCDVFKDMCLSSFGETVPSSFYC